MTTLHVTDSPALDYLFSETLFDLADQKANTSQMAFMGNAAATILFIVEKNEGAYFAEAEEEAFLKTLLALKLSLEDVAVSHKFLATENASLKETLALYQAHQVVFLGIPPNIFADGQNIEINALTKIADKNILFTHSFKEMLRDMPKKRLFWDTIKDIHTWN